MTLKRPLGHISLKTALGPPSFHKQDKSAKVMQDSRKRPSSASLQMWLWRITDKEKGPGDGTRSHKEQQTKNATLRATSRSHLGDVPTSGAKTHPTGSLFVRTDGCCIPFSSFHWVGGFFFFFGRAGGCYPGQTMRSCIQPRGGQGILSREPSL